MNNSDSNKKFEKLTARMIINLAAPHTWVASVTPSLFAAVFCRLFGLGLGLVKSVALIIVCILMQSAVNTFNDYFDYVKGTDTSDDNLAEYDAVLLNNNIDPKEALKLGIVFLAAAAVTGIWAAWGSGITPYVIGITGGLCVIFYSGGSRPISYMPLGEFVSGIVMGGGIPVAITSIAAGGLTRECLVVFIDSIPFIIGIAMIMMTNNTCDIEKDIEANRNTMPARTGRERAKKIYGTLAKAWLALIMILPVLTIGISGFISAVIIWIAVRKFFRFLWTSPLTQENRINQMKGIIMANICGNGVYILIFLVKAAEI